MWAHLVYGAFAVRRAAFNTLPAHMLVTVTHTDPSLPTYVPPRACSAPQVRLVVANPANGCEQLTGATQGAVIVVARGRCGSIAKARAVRDAGGIAMIAVSFNPDTGYAQAPDVSLINRDEQAVDFPVAGIPELHGNWIFGNASSSATITITRTQVGACTCSTGKRHRVHSA